VIGKRPTLKEELEFALRKITGTSFQFNEDVISYVSQQISLETGEDPAVVSLRLIEQIKKVVAEDIERQMRRCRPCARQLKRV